MEEAEAVLYFIVVLLCEYDIYISFRQEMRVKLISCAACLEESNIWKRFYNPVAMLI